MTKEERSIRMAQIRSVCTKPEIELRRSLWRHGFRYSVNDDKYPGKPDIVLSRHRTMVFIHGCFWHGHKGCRYAHIPKTNTDFWTAKIARNQQRDQEVWRKLEALGWYVIVVWECQLKKAQFEATLEYVINEIRNNGDTFNKVQADRRAAREKYLEERKFIKEKESKVLSEIKKGLLMV